ncbi:MAG TPA: hypothetical protein VK709_21425 [Candidatus Saccharimonadales bacterium]|nr:hypothetical protein [Candidatus Saccharimonadales bacterium]
MKKVALGLSLGAMVLSGMAAVVAAQGPPPPGGFRSPGPGGPMPGMFEIGGLMGGFGGKVVTGKPILATITITHTETLPGNSISNTSTGTYARGADGSTYRDVKFSGIGPWSAGGTAKEFAYIRNITTGMEYIVNVSKGTYVAFPLRERKPSSGSKFGPLGGPNANDENVTDNPNGSYKDPGTTNVYPADDKLVTRTIPVMAIGNTNVIIITSERWFSNALELVLENTHTDPRFGTTTYQLSNIGQSPSASLFTPNPAFTQVQGEGFAMGGRHGQGKQHAAPPQN